jgi:hypothetical protein
MATGSRESYKPMEYIPTGALYPGKIPKSLYYLKTPTCFGSSNGHFQGVTSTADRSVHTHAQEINLYKFTIQNYTTMYMQKMLHIKLKLAKPQTFKIYTNSSFITSVLIVCSYLHVHNFLQYLDVKN